ncbi:shikimate dehydrogenase [Alkalibacillus haloalkaliphilus]|uniref:Shikimate dehydrogenase (NADP(+)) n=1 Tax=Alkalibacillus haloalkaliphilus TaxID=94136 RepID=A0A511WAY2_9BACI|nr:shikimate dehydrogenase [Alkalibacillus haloalkaliphilus]GEN46472.1 shikimate dehydrogenase (NADP(+)) [Alkalibacillus haloalkaliphilus]
MFRLGLIGNPVSQSKSPHIHHKLLQENNLKGHYQLIHTEADNLGENIEWLKGQGFTGFNVTVPYKEKVIEYLDFLEDSARVMGSVNTVKIDQGKLIGYNTDGKGYIRSLITLSPNFLKDAETKSVLILGAGGAAKGIAHQLLQSPFKQVNIANRSLKRAQSLVNQLGASHFLTLTEATEELAQYDLIINTTSVGMSPHESEQVIPLNGVKPGTIISDIVYKPKWTSFLIEAKQRNCQLLFGESMLYYQAVKAFEIWTNPKYNLNQLRG